MMSNYFEIKVEIEKIVSYTNHTGHKHTGDKIMHGECRYQKRHGACNRKRASDSNQDEVHIAMMNSARGPLEYVPS